MQRFFALTLLVWAGWPLAVSAAPSVTNDTQDHPARITVVSVLIMAREAVETESNQNRRESLRIQVAEAIKRLWHNAAFGNYVEEVLSPVSQRLGHWDDDPNRKEAKRLFLTGDVEAAKQRLGRVQCIGRFCMPINDATLSFLFFHWEMESGDLPAVLHRLRTTDWQDSAPIMAVQVARAYIVAGREMEIRDLISEIDDRFEEAAKRGLLADGAVFRKLSRAGEAARAISIAQSEQDTRKHVRGLIIIAEGLLGIPGLPNEPLIEVWER
jgi:hypothetical protein